MAGDLIEDNRYVSDMKEAALDYAAQGWPIFPVGRDKKPLFKNWQDKATTNRETIINWWDEYPDANIALQPAEIGMMVLDLDPGYDEEELIKYVGSIETALYARTPRGGTHLFFNLNDGERVSPSTSKLASHVDVRSWHSYVLLTPSETKDGAYTWEGTGTPAHRTDEMVRLSNSGREKHEDRDTWIIDPDLDENVERAIKWLTTEAKPAIEKSGGDDMTYKTAAMCKSYGISQALALDLMFDHYNPRCVPPWDYDDLQIKVENA